MRRRVHFATHIFYFICCYLSPSIHQFPPSNIAHLHRNSSSFFIPFLNEDCCESLAPLSIPSFGFTSFGIRANRHSSSSFLQKKKPKKRESSNTVEPCSCKNSFVSKLCFTPLPQANEMPRSYGYSFEECNMWAIKASKYHHEEPTKERHPKPMSEEFILWATDAYLNGTFALEDFNDEQFDAIDEELQQRKRRRRKAREKEERRRRETLEHKWQCWP